MAEIKIIEVNEPEAISSQCVRERIESGKRPGTREFVASVDGDVAGLLIFEHYPRESMGFVYEIFVLEEFRERGLGGMLLTHAETIALQVGCVLLRLFVRSLDQEYLNDVQLAAWYSRRGFTEEAIRPPRWRRA